MPEEPKKINSIDSSAADFLLQAVSSVGEDAKVVVIVRNTEDDFTITANMNVKDLYWLLGQAVHGVMRETFDGAQEE